MGGPDDAAHQAKLAGLSHEMDRLDAWQFEQEFTSILTELAISDTSLLMGSLSGGMVRKVDLARALVEDSALLLLDEPTNHLDIETSNWLQDYLQRTSKAVVLVTHDRYFLDAICTRIYEIENESVLRYDGNYAYYLEKRDNLDLAEAREQDRIQNVLRRELTWLRRGPKARSTKQKARIDRYDELSAKVTSDEQKCIAFEVGFRRLGKTILELDAVTKSWDGRQVLAPFSRISRPGERLGLVCANGSGKTTLLNLMTGRLVPDTGTVKPGQNNRFGIFDQTSHGMNPETRVLDFLEEESLQIKRADGAVLSATRLLEDFLFPKRMLYEKIGKLSGGERRRLQLVRILLPDPNFLIFDEPTNDLDIQTLSLLEEFLLGFQGCLVLVSHDRYFLDRVAKTLLVFDGQGGIEEFSGSYGDWIAQTGGQLDQPKTDKQDKTQKTGQNLAEQSSSQAKKGLSYKEKKEFAAILDLIQELEDEKCKLELVFSEASADHEGMQRASLRYQELVVAIESASARWEELALRDEAAG
jgi:ATP-binding cassette subfamily F protein uup